MKWPKPHTVRSVCGFLFVDNLPLTLVLRNSFRFQSLRRNKFSETDNNTFNLAHSHDLSFNAVL